MANRTLSRRRLVFSASSALAVTLSLLALAGGCSAPDPGEIPYRAPPPRPKPISTAVAVAPTDGGAAGGDDGAVFQAPYVVGAAKLSSSHDKHAALPELQNQKNPAGHSCVNECHGPGGKAALLTQTALFSAGGTVYTDQTGATAAPAGVEVRIRNTDGTAASAYTDELGNFFIRQSDFTIQSGATSALRNATQTMYMVSALAAGVAGGGCANGNGCHAVGGLGGVLRLKN